MEQGVDLRLSQRFSFFVLHVVTQHVSSGSQVHFCTEAGFHSEVNHSIMKVHWAEFSLRFLTDPL